MKSPHSYKSLIIVFSIIIFSIVLFSNLGSAVGTYPAVDPNMGGLL